MKLQKHGKLSRTASKQLKRSIKYEVWINGRLIFTKRNWLAWNEYTTLKWLRETIEMKFPNQSFEVYKIMRSQFPPAGLEEKEMPKKTPVLNMRPAAEYSNSSPYKIAK